MYFLLSKLQMLLLFHALEMTCPLSRYVQTTFNSPYHSFNMLALHIYFINRTFFFFLYTDGSFYQNSFIPTVKQSNSLRVYRLSRCFKSRDRSQSKKVLLQMRQGGNRTWREKPQKGSEDGGSASPEQGGNFMAESHHIQYVTHIQLTIKLKRFPMK